MTQHIRIALGFAAACGIAVVLSAQTPSQPQTPPRPQTPTSQPSTRSDMPQAGTTIVGCLRAEKDVPGLTPNVAERAGVGEDYILTNVRVGPATSSPSGTAAGTTGGGTTPEATTAPDRRTGLMYKITGLDRNELKKHVNHQVELQGKVEDDAVSPGRMGTPTTTPDPAGTGTMARQDMKPKEFEATSLRMISATCPGGTY